MATETRTDLWESVSSCGGSRRWRHSRMPEDLRVSGWGAVPGWYRVPAFILSRGWEEEGGKRKQEKGTVSRQVPSVCLHIVFSRDIPRFARDMLRSEEHKSELQSLMRSSYAVFCLKKKTQITK